jgi:5-methylthioadenosine/S-adenosylhomocysteine deaminase
MVEMATIDGARVLGLDDRIGTLIEGREADLICVDTDRAHATPLYDPYSHLVFAARAADIRHVVVRGRVTVRRGQLETIDLEALLAEVEAMAEQVRGA